MHVWEVEARNRRGPAQTAIQSAPASRQRNPPALRLNTYIKDAASGERLATVSLGDCAQRSAHGRRPAIEGQLGEIFGGLQPRIKEVTPKLKIVLQFVLPPIFLRGYQIAHHPHTALRSFEAESKLVSECHSEEFTVSARREENSTRRESRRSAAAWSMSAV